MEQKVVSTQISSDNNSTEYSETPVIHAVIHVPQSIYGLGPSKFACHFRAAWPKEHKEVASEEHLSLKRNVATVKLVKNDFPEIKDSSTKRPNAADVSAKLKETKSNTEGSLTVRYITLPSTEKFQDEYEKASARYHSEQTIFDVLSIENTGTGLRQESLDAKLHLNSEELWQKVTNHGEYIIKHIYTEREPCSFKNYKEPCNDLIRQLATAQFGKYGIPIEVHYTNPYIDGKSKPITQKQFSEGKHQPLSQNPDSQQALEDELSKNIYLGKKIIYNNFTTQDQMTNIAEDIKGLSKERKLLKEIQAVRKLRDEKINEWKQIIADNTENKNPDFSSKQAETELAIKGGEAFDKVMLLRGEINDINKYLTKIEKEYFSLVENKKPPPTIKDHKPKFDEDTVKCLENLKALKIEHKQLIYNIFNSLNTNNPDVAVLVNICQRSLGETNLLIQQLKVGAINSKDIEEPLKIINIKLEKYRVTFLQLQEQEKMQEEREKQKDKRKQDDNTDPRSIIPVVKSTAQKRQKIDLPEKAKEFEIALEGYKTIVKDKGLEETEHPKLFQSLKLLNIYINQMKNSKSTVYNPNDQDLLDKTTKLNASIENIIKPLNNNTITFTK